MRAWKAKNLLPSVCRYFGLSSSVWRLSSLRANAKQSSQFNCRLGKANLHLLFSVTDLFPCTLKIFFISIPFLILLFDQKAHLLYVTYFLFNIFPCNDMYNIFCNELISLFPSSFKFLIDFSPFFLTLCLEYKHICSYSKLYVVIFICQTG